MGIRADLRKRIQELEALVAELETEVQELNYLVLNLDMQNAELEVAIQDLQAKISNKNQVIFELNTEIAELSSQVSELEQKLSDCEGQLPPPSPPPSDVIHVPAGANLQAALKNAPEGATLQLENATYFGKNFIPKKGQTIKGPAFIVPGGAVGDNDDGFRCKASGVVEDVTFIDLDVSGFGRHGIGVWIGTTILGGRYHHNGKDGIGGDLEGRVSRNLVSNVEIDNNGNDHWLGAGSGGIKWFHSHGVTVTGSYIHDNYGNGVWCDAQCGDMTVIDNRIINNTRKGVFYEKGGESDGSFLNRDYAIFEGFLTVTGNTIKNNNTEGVDNAHPGVALYSSKNALIGNNDFGGNSRAVIVRNDPNRITDDKHGWYSENIAIINNRLNGDMLVGCDLEGVTCSGNI